MNNPKQYQVITTQVGGAYSKSQWLTLGQANVYIQQKMGRKSTAQIRVISQPVYGKVFNNSLKPRWANR